MYVLQEILFQSLYFKISCFMQFIYLTNANLIVNRNCFEIFMCRKAKDIKRARVKSERRICEGQTFISFTDVPDLHLLPFTPTLSKHMTITTHQPISFQLSSPTACVCSPPQVLRVIDSGAELNFHKWEERNATGQSRWGVGRDVCQNLLMLQTKPWWSSADEFLSVWKL